VSIELMSRVWALPSTERFLLTPARRLVLLALADHANDEGVAWPSQRGLAAKCGVSRKTVNECLAAARDTGLLSVEQTTDEHGRPSVCRYILRLAVGVTEGYTSPPGEPGGVVTSREGEVSQLGRGDVTSGDTEPSVQQPYVQQPSTAGTFSYTGTGTGPASHPPGGGIHRELPADVVAGLMERYPERPGDDAFGEACKLAFRLGLPETQVPFWLTACRYPLGWIMAAMEKAGAVDKASVPYVHGILEGYRRDGGPGARDQGEEMEGRDVAWLSQKTG